MTEHRYAELAARLLRASRGRIGPHPSARPADAVAVLTGVIRGTAARRRRRRIVKWAGAVGAAAGIVLFVGWTLIRPMADLAVSPGPTFVVEGTPVATVTAIGGPSQPLLPGRQWRSGERLQTDGRSISLATKDETAIEVEPHSDLLLARADSERWLRLGGGAVDVHVAKLKAAERFVITTSDAEVEVRGTRFRVAVVPAIDDCGRGTVTRVSVTEGVVVVRWSGQQKRVEAGSRWPADCVERSVSVAPPPAADLRAPSNRQTSPRTSAVRVPPAGGAAPSTLATENDLFGAALKAASAGDRREAMQLLDVLLARFPASPLKESAAAERARLLGAAQARR